VIDVEPPRRICNSSTARTRSPRHASTVGTRRAGAEHERADLELLALLDQRYRFSRAIEHRLRVVHDRPTIARPRVRSSSTARALLGA
jgi:glutamine synthetase adenylyltransferase